MESYRKCECASRREHLLSIHPSSIYQPMYLTASVRVAPPAAATAGRYVGYKTGGWWRVKRVKREENGGGREEGYLL